MLAFNFFFLAPTHTLRLADSENWVALAVYVVTAISVSELATRARRRAREIRETEPRRRSDAVKTAVLRSVSHDLRSPVTEPVEMRAEDTGTEVVLRIPDHGPGIPPDQHALIFEAFHGSGSGLGLAIARGFVQLNGGRIWVESETGRGTTFAIAFPAVR